MSWSLRLSPRLSPAVPLGVSEETSTIVNAARRFLSLDALIRVARTATSPVFLEQHTAPCGAVLVLEGRPRLEEMTITAA
jgi:hypothetical protein